jgi:glycosyltransferase involved in cell wall biosynthesis
MSTLTPPATAKQPSSDARTSDRIVPSGIVHVCNGLDPVRDGGMVPSILGMTGALAELGTTPTCIVTTTPSRAEMLAIPPSLKLYGPEVDYRQAISDADVVHLHGLWQRQTRVGGREALRCGVPYVVAAHGMAEPWALKQKALKKAVYLRLVERSVLRNASCLHALTRPEREHLRRIAPRTPIAWIPNGVSLSPFEKLPARTQVETRYPQIAGKFTLLFLSRLHVKKGLDMLAQALADAWGTRPDWHLLVAGAEDGAGEPFVQQMKSLGLESHLTMVGHVAGEKAQEMWAAADAFILPSRSEGFSMSVLESLAASVPAVITTACHFPELAIHEGGLVCDPDVASIGRSLDRLKNEMTAADRSAMASRGRALAERDYTWASQARRLTQVYDWVRGGGARPDFVE